MLGHYRRAFVKLANLVNCLDAWSADAPSVCLRIQLEIIPRIKRVEQKIRYWKSVSPRTDEIREKIESYQRIGRTLRQFGDAIAFTYIDRWDIKAWARGRPAGFISGKKGFSLERRILRAVANRNERALLTDLTNCLRQGDIFCFGHDRPPLVMEVKDSKRRKLDRRGIKQKRRMQGTADYLRTDETEIHGSIWRRVSLANEIIDHKKAMSEVAKEAFAYGVAVRRVKRSLAYMAMRKFNEQVFDELVEGMSAPMPVLLTSDHYCTGDEYPYFPISLVISDPEVLADYLAARMVLGVAIDYAYIEERVRSQGAEIRLLDPNDSDPWIFEILHPGDITSRVSAPMFGRVAYEFWDIDYFIDSFLLDLSEISLLADDVTT